MNDEGSGAGEAEVLTISPFLNKCIVSVMSTNIRIFECSKILLRMVFVFVFVAFLQYGNVLNICLVNSWAPLGPL